MKYRNIIFRSIGGKEKFPPMPITESEYEKVKQFMFDKKADVIEIKNRIIRKSDIDFFSDEFDKIQEETTWICDYGKQHNMKDGCFFDEKTGEKEWSAMNCGCENELKIKAIDFLRWCQRYYQIIFIHQIKDHMRNEFLRTNTI